MATASPLTSKYFLLQWVFIKGKPVKNFYVEKLYCHGGDPENIWLCDNVDTCLCEDDCKVFGKLIKQKIEMWVKIIQDSKKDKNRTSYQACFLCIEGKNDLQVENLREFVDSIKDQYGCRELLLFPWYQDIYYEKVKTYQDK